MDHRLPRHAAWGPRARTALPRARAHPLAGAPAAGILLRVYSQGGREDVRTFLRSIKEQLAPQHARAAAAAPVFALVGALAVSAERLRQFSPVKGHDKLGSCVLEELRLRLYRVVGGAAGGRLLCLRRGCRACARGTVVLPSLGTFHSQRGQQRACEGPAQICLGVCAALVEGSLVACVLAGAVVERQAHRTLSRPTPAASPPQITGETFANDTGVRRRALDCCFALMVRRLVDGVQRATHLHAVRPAMAYCYLVAAWSRRLLSNHPGRGFPCIHRLCQHLHFPRTIKIHSRTHLGRR